MTRPARAIACTTALWMTFSLACASTTEEEPPPAPEPVAVEPEPAPPPPPPPAAPEPAPVPVAAELPKTASPLPAVGLTGLGALGLAGGLRLARRRL